MLKWGVRLIGIFFFFGALWDLYELLMDRNNLTRFLGISGGITYDDQYVEIIGWIGIFIFLYTGYQLFKLSAAGRSWALAILWPFAILTGLTLIVFAVFAVASLDPLKEITMYAYLGDVSRKIDSPLGVLLYIGLFFLFYSAQVYFLMRGDVKLEFHETEKSKGAY